jgi:hypothetical protein
VSLLLPRRFYQSRVPIEAAAGGGALNFSVVGTTVSAGSTIGIPGVPTPGDFAFIAETSQNVSGTPADVNPAAWTVCIDGLSGQVRLKLWAKIFDGTEADPVPIVDGTSTDRSVLAVFRPSIPLVNFTPNIGATLGFTVTNNDPAARTIGASAAASLPVILFAAARGGVDLTGLVTISPDDMVEIGPPSGSTMRGFYKVYNSGETPVDHTIDMSDVGNNNGLWSSFFTFET